MRRRTALTLATAAAITRPARAETYDLNAHIQARDSKGYVAILPDGTTQTAGTSGTPRPLDIDTIFEIGSITKVFTALLVADMVQRNELTLHDPISKFLPKEALPIPYDDAEITLQDLVTYTSGLPRIPTDLPPDDLTDPYAAYTPAKLYAFLAGYKPLHYPGAHYEYANLGFGLLGHILALHAGRPYEDLIRSRIAAPLGLENTTITLTPEQKDRLAQGHDAALKPVPNWNFDVLAGAGALRSSARDMARFLACAQTTPNPLTPAFQSLLKTRRQTDTPKETAGAGWFIHTEPSDEIIWKDGGTGGYATFIGFSRRTGSSAVLLANTAAYSTTTKLGLHMVNATIPAPPARTQLDTPPASLPRLAGTYRINPSFALTVTPRDGHLYVQATNQGEYEVYPESETTFFYRVVNAQLTFDLPAEGPASSVTLHQNGRDLRGRRSK
jgi:CubicO group peptidase (beta-lactamase class C family)